jgi:hypothetical protein
MRILALQIIAALTCFSGTHLWAGEAISLTHGRLLLPTSPVGETVDLHIHLHGSAAGVEESFRNSGMRAALLTIHRPGLSSAYSGFFADPQVWQRILDEAASHLSSHAGHPATLGRVTISSFSAGFGGVRELLKQEEAFARIDGLLLADSLYAGFSGSPDDRRIDHALMAGFSRFAREAAAGRKRLLLTHSSLPTPTYASTEETASYLIEVAGGRAQPVRESWSPRLVLTRRFENGNLLILGFSGQTGDDHLAHLRDLHLFLPLLLAPGS